MMIALSDERFRKRDVVACELRRLSWMYTRIMLREVNVQTRRSFIQALSVSGLVLACADDDATEAFAPADDRRASHGVPLRGGWEFRPDPSGAAQPSDALDQAPVWSPVP